MRFLFPLCLLGSFALTGWADEARSAFDSKNYGEAVKQLEPQLAAAGPSAEGYANLALANEKAGAPIQAALNYERALLLDPGLKSAKNAMAELAAAQKISLPPRTWRDDVTAIVHPETLVLMGTALAWLGAFIFVFAMQMPRRAMVIAGAVLAMVFGGAAVIAGILSDPRIAPGRPAMVMNKDGAEVLSAPSNNSSAIVSLPAGAPISVRSPRGAWTYVDLAGGVKGWVQTERLAPLVPGETF